MLIGRKCGQWLSLTKMVNVSDVVTIVVSMRWNFIILILLEKTLAFPAKGTRVVGIKLKPSWINARYCAQIAIVRFMLKTQLSRVIGIEKAG